MTEVLAGVARWLLDVRLAAQVVHRRAEDHHVGTASAVGRRDWKAMA